MWLVEVLSYLMLSHIPTSHLFRQRAEILNNYASVVLDSTPNVFCWCHRVFNHVAKNYYLLDGVHLNCAGQYQLYHSYRLVFFTFYFDFYLDVVPSTVVHGLVARCIPCTTTCSNDALYFTLPRIILQFSLKARCTPCSLYFCWILSSIHEVYYTLQRLILLFLFMCRVYSLHFVILLDFVLNSCGVFHITEGYPLVFFLF